MTELVLGKGRLYFERFIPNTRRRSGTGFGYLGNTPELTVTTSEEKVEHYSSEGGLNVKDASVVISSTRSGGFKTDHMSSNNLALWYRGDKASVTQLAGAGVIDAWPVSVKGNYFQLGETDDQPQGARNVSNVLVSKGTAAATGTLTFTTAVPVEADTVTINGTVFTFRAVPAAAHDVLIGGTLGASATNLRDVINGDESLPFTATAAGAVVTVHWGTMGTAGNAVTLAKGFATAGDMVLSGATLAGGTQTVIAPADNITLLAEGSTGIVRVNPDAPNIAEGDSLIFTYDQAAVTLTTVIDGSTTLEGRMMFVADNPVGENKDHLWPYVQLSADGDYALIGDDWQNIGFTYEVLKLNDDTPREIITNRGVAG